MKSYDYYLFDADGTLFETTELIYRCFVYSLRKHANREIPREEIIASIGLTLRKQFEHHIGPLSDAQFDRIQADHMNYQMSIYRDYLAPCPGVPEAIEKLRAAGKTLAIVTSRKIASLSCFLRETGIYDCFSVMVTPDETEHHKPHPEPALKALELLNAAPEAALFVGDAPFDIECGQRAHTDTAFVAWSHNNPEHMPRKPTHIIYSMLDLCI
ncbi:MAG: HAD-IA family hydrolase [Deltaproteobacteria bacterium]|nr:HAD-IA family hydrolase [Deltaproteobacteria bacterium]